MTDGVKRRLDLIIVLLVAVLLLTVWPLLPLSDLLAVLVVPFAFVGAIVLLAGVLAAVDPR